MQSLRGGYSGSAEAPSWGSRGGLGRGREVPVGENGVDRRGGRPKEKPRGLTVGAGSGLAAVSVFESCWRRGEFSRGGWTAKGPPLAPSPPGQSNEVLAFSKIVKN